MGDNVSKLREAMSGIRKALEEGDGNKAGDLFIEEINRQMTADAPQPTHFTGLERRNATVAIDEAIDAVDEARAREAELLRLCLAFFNAGGVVMGLIPKQAETLEALQQFVLDHPWVVRGH